MAELIVCEDYHVSPTHPRRNHLLNISFYLEFFLNFWENSKCDSEISCHVLNKGAFYKISAVRLLSVFDDQSNNRFFAGVDQIILSFQDELWSKAK
jgi:hypothetical protein